MNPAAVAEIVDFAGLLRCLRRAAGLTQAALAERAGVGARTIQDLERGLHLPIGNTIEQLTRALALSGAQRSQFEEAARPRPRRQRVLALAPRLAAVRPDSTDAPRRRHNLPAALTSFVGRADQLTAIEARLREESTPTRLLTLVGAGGCGKTRLALQVAGNVLDHFLDGVWLVDLGSLSEPTLVLPAIATALGLGEGPGRPLGETLTLFLRDCRALLLLDNCEHLIDACARIVDTLLRACGQLRILATSRELLRVEGEASLGVPPLSLFDPRLAGQKTEDMVDEALAAEAVQLFIDRARLLEPAFTVTPDNVRAVIRVCQRLDGIPLAIELAATRVNALSVEQIANRLDRRFGLLTAGRRTTLPRHQTLRAAVEWSYDLLSEPERTLFNRLSVFAGSFDLAAAEAVCGTQPDVLNVLIRLVDKSLVVADEPVAENRRYHLLETLREFAQERLAAAGEATATRNRHRDWSMELARRAEPHTWGDPDDQHWVKTLDLSHDNLRAALAWCHETDPNAGLELAVDVSVYWRRRGHYAEGRRWLEQMLAAASEPSRGRAYALLGLGAIIGDLEHLAQGVGLIDESVALFRELDDKFGLARALYERGAFSRHLRDERARSYLAEALDLATQTGNAATALRCTVILGWAALDIGDIARARSFFDEALELTRSTGSVYYLGWTLYSLGNLADVEGRHADAKAHFEHSLRITREADDRFLTGRALTHLSRVYAHLGDDTQAHALLGRSLAVLDQLGHRVGLAAGFAVAGILATRRQAFTRAARLFGAAERVVPRVGTGLDPGERADHDASRAEARMHLGEDEFALAWAEGRAMTQAQAIACAVTYDST